MASCRVSCRPSPFRRGCACPPARIRAPSGSTASAIGWINSYEKLGFANSNSIKSYAMWDHLAREGKKSIIVGVPPNFPPRRINGISVGCFLTPDTTKDEFTYPSSIKAKITELVGEYPVDVKNFRTDRKDWLRDEIFAMSRKQWKVVKWLLTEQEWDYFHFVDIGLDRVHHGFWNYFDKKHVQYEPGNPYENVIPDYYLWLDEQIGEVMELLDERNHPAGGIGPRCPAPRWRHRRQSMVDRRRSARAR